MVANGAPIARKPTCGIVMPISAWDGCTESHWADVREILEEAVDEAGFEPNLVSNADEVSVIQKRIVQNLYDNPIVICDVSGRNANVMFELGLRLAFDKPTIIIKDDKTPFSFDTSPIEHLEYPRDLRFAKVVEFKGKLGEKIKSTHEHSTKDPKYSTFLRHFGEFTVAKLDKKEIPSQQFMLEELKGIRASIDKLHATSRAGDLTGSPGRPPIIFTMTGRTAAEVDEARRLAESFPGVSRVSSAVSVGNEPRLFVRMPGASHEERQLLRAALRSRYPIIGTSQAEVTKS
jgi:hypothetical protein